MATLGIFIKRLFKVIVWLAVIGAVIYFGLPYINGRTAALQKLPSLGPKGGTITQASGIKLTIPEGVLAQSVKFKITAATKDDMKGLPGYFVMYGGADIEPQTKIVTAGKALYTAIMTVPLNHALHPDTTLLVLKKNKLDGVITNANILAKVNDDSVTATFTTHDTGILLLATEETPNP